MIYIYTVDVTRPTVAPPNLGARNFGGICVIGPAILAFRLSSQGSALSDGRIEITAVTPPTEVVR